MARFHVTGDHVISCDAYIVQDVANDLWKSTFQLERSMSVHALYGRDREQVTCMMKCWDIAEEGSCLVAGMPLA